MCCQTGSSTLRAFSPASRSSVAILVLDGRSDGVRDGVSGDSEHLGQGRDGDAWRAQFAHGPGDLPGGELLAWGRHLLDIGERRCFANSSWQQTVAPLAPYHVHGHFRAGRIVLQHRRPAVTDGQHPARGAPHQGVRGLDHPCERRPVTLNRAHVDIGQVEKRTLAQLTWDTSRLLRTVGLCTPILEALTPTWPRCTHSVLLLTTSSGKSRIWGDNNSLVALVNVP